MERILQFLNLKGRKGTGLDPCHLNNRPCRPAITKNRAQIFKTYNYRFKSLKYRSIAS